MVQALADRKGEKIALLDLADLVSFTDYFILCSGTSTRMLGALSDAVCEVAKKEAGLPARVEGRTEFGWVLVDCGDIIIHLFTPQQREHYNLEKMWDQARVLVRLQ